MPINGFDIFTFARCAQEMRGVITLADLPRLLSVVSERSAQALDGYSFDWKISGECRKTPLESSKVETTLYLHIQIEGTVELACQRCLTPCKVPLHIGVSCRIVESEALAEQAPMDEDEDVIVGSHEFDLAALLEEELLLALPWVPKHEVCPAEEKLSQELAHGSKRANPFAALATLKTGEDSQNFEE
jgi:uncharacterized protein